MLHVSHAACVHVRTVLEGKGPRCCRPLWKGRSSLDTNDQGGVRQAMARRHWHVPASTYMCARVRVLCVCCVCASVRACTHVRMHVCACARR